MKSLGSHIITVFLLLLRSNLFAQEQCPIDTRAFDAGEELKYNAYYNWGFIWLHAGEAEFSVKDKQYNGRKVLHLKAYGTTYKSYDWIFTVREKYQSYIDPETLMPLWYERDVKEGSYTAFENYIFDYPNRRINTYVQKRDRPGVNGTLELTPCLLDVMTAIYYFRSVDFNRYQTGDQIPIHMILDSHAYHLYIRYLGKETVKTRNKTPYRCIKCAIQLVEGTMFKGDEDAVVWVTDDANRIPVVVEAQIVVGSVKAILTEAKGLKQRTANSDNQ
ncbi:MAG: DUF3108 domain-containing protein [Bacteroidales bacterium]|jgi:hypothetical protein|nr:DUF3108 domain-containing protein [Bacteroidales bacterium]